MQRGREGGWSPIDESGYHDIYGTSYTRDINSLHIIQHLAPFHTMSLPRFIKDTYAYKLLSAIMYAFISNHFWTTSLQDNTNTRQEIQFKIAAVIMGLCCLFQILMNIGLIGDQCDKNKSRPSRVIRRRVHVE